MATKNHPVGGGGSGVINIRQILFPTDFSDLSLYVLKYAVDFARSYAATLHLLHVVDDAYRYIVSMGPDSVPVGPPPEDLINAATREMQAFVAEHLPDPPFEVKTDVVAGRPFMEIIQYARDHEIDMIVIGTHGRSGLTHVLLGSVAEKVVRKAPCPVLSIRHPDQRFVMP